MLIELSKFEGMAVGALDEGMLIGRVRYALVDPDEIKVVGFAVKEKGLFAKLSVVSILDVVDIEKGAMVINSKENLVDKDEIVRIGKILKYKFKLLGLPARTKSGQMLGRLTDVVVDSDTGDINRFYTQFLLQHRVFERPQIEKITWQEIIIDNEEGRKIKVKPKPKEILPVEGVPDIVY